MTLRTPLHQSKPLGSTLFKPLQPNPKFATIKPIIDTGKNANNLKPKIDRSHEPFKRITRRTLFTLLNLHHSENIMDLMSLETQSQFSSTTTTNESYLIQLLQNSTTENPLFLIVDARSEEEYKRCHIESAINFTPVQLRQDRMIQQLVQFREKANKILIVYDLDDGKLAAETAKAFVERQFDVYVLTKGLLGFADMFKERIVGQLAPEQMRFLINQQNSKDKASKSSTMTNKIWKGTARSYNNR